MVAIVHPAQQGKRLPVKMAVIAPTVKVGKDSHPKVQPNRSPVRSVDRTQVMDKRHALKPQVNHRPALQLDKTAVQPQQVRPLKVDKGNDPKQQANPKVVFPVEETAERLPAAFHPVAPADREAVSVTLPDATLLAVS
jgi:hypothetical protein